VMLSDAGFAVADALALPTFAAPGHERLYTRLTLIVRDGRIEHVFYPIFPPNIHAQEVLDWLRLNQRQ
jgi:peroxiredoxin